MALTQQPMPSRDPMIDRDSGLVSRPWQKFFRQRGDIVATAPLRAGSASLDDQHKDILGVAIPMVVSGGLYRVNIYARRTVVATVSSSLAVSMFFTDRGVVQELAVGPSIVNSLTETLVGTGLIRADPGSVISYAVDYDSVNPDEMRYALDVVVEQVQV